METVSEGDDGARRMLAIAYIRTSTTRQGETGKGLQLQRAAIEAFAKRASYELVEIFPEIASARGEKNLEKRPALLQALASAKRLGAVLIVHDWARLTRHEPDYATINAHLPAHRIFSVEKEENLARASTAGRLAYGQAKGDAISEATREGMARKKLREGVEYGNPEIRQIQPNGAAAAQAKSRRLREAIADVIEQLGGLNHGLSNSQVAEKLNALNLRTAQDRSFDARSVATPLRDAMEILRGRDQKPPGWGRF